MTTCSYALDNDDPKTAPYGLIALQSDETIEPEFARYFSDNQRALYVSRVQSSTDVTNETLASMEQALPAATSLLPSARKYAVVAYGCTSGSSVVGSDTVERIVRANCETDHVTNPLCATLACAAENGVNRLALLSPYIGEVNTSLRTAFAEKGLSTDVFGTFAVKEEAKVVRISNQSVFDAAVKLGSDPSVEAVFISCTNLRTIDVLQPIAARIGKPVMSSNQALAWHMRRLAEHNRTKPQKITG